ncbi:YolD-like family protein, partial [Bacillus amyloliquefaciens]
YEQHKLHIKDHHDQIVYITMNDIIGVAYND